MEIYFKVIVIVVVIGVFAYGIFISEAFRKGPTISVISPIDGATISSPVLVKGRIENASYASINDRKILVKRNGEFEEMLSLPSGFSIIKLYASDSRNRYEEYFINLIIIDNNGNKKETKQTNL